GVNSWDSANIRTTTGPLFFGQNPGGPREQLDGSLDNISLWNVALSQSQIQTYMNQVLAGTESGLQGYWNFNEASGNRAFDKTANHNDGYLPGITQGAPGALTTDTDTAYRFTGGQVSLSGVGLNTAANAVNTASFWMYWDGNDNMMPLGFTTYDLWFQ